MYIGVVLSVFGQAIVFASRDIAVYGALLWLTFHIVVVALEEPHLREQLRVVSTRAIAAVCRAGSEFGHVISRHPRRPPSS